MKSQYKSIGIIVLIAVALLMIYEVVAITWVKSLLRGTNHQLYIGIYFSSLFVLLAVFKKRLLLFSLTKTAMIGTVTGHVVGITSLLLASLQNKDGAERWMKSVETFGLDYLLSLNIGVFMLGAWLLGGVMFGLARFLHRKLES